MCATWDLERSENICLHNYLFEGTKHHMVWIPVRFRDIVMLFQGIKSLAVLNSKHLLGKKMAIAFYSSSCRDPWSSGWLARWYKKIVILGSFCFSVPGIPKTILNQQTTGKIYCMSSWLWGHRPLLHRYSCYRVRDLQRMPLHSPF